MDRATRCDRDRTTMDTDRSDPWRGVGEIGTVPARQRFRGDRERAIDAVAPAVRADDVAAAALGRRADDGSAHERVGDAPMNGRRTGGAFYREMRREPDVFRRRRQIDAQIKSLRSTLQYTPSS